MTHSETSFVPERTKPFIFFTPRYLFLLSLILFLSVTGFAQFLDEAKYGIKGGINFAELYGEDAIPESDRKVGYSLGAYMNLPMSNKFSIQPEAIWSLQGETSKDNGRYKINYLNIPVMFKWKEANFYYEVGPQLGILAISSSKSIPEEFRIDKFDTFDASVVIGLGYVLDEDWSLGFRYAQGFTNLVKGLDLKNSVIYFGFSHRLF